MIDGVGVYKLCSSEYKCLISKSNENAMTWHRRLGHINYVDLCKMRDGVVSGMQFENDEITVNIFEVCSAGKQTRLPFKASNNKRALNVLDLIHADLCGPMETPSIGGAKYYQILIDDHTQKVFVQFLKLKLYRKSLISKILLRSNLSEKLRSFVLIMVENIVQTVFQSSIVLWEG